MQGSVSQNDLNVNSDYEEAFTQQRSPVKRSYSTPARPRPLQFSRPRNYNYLASAKPDLSPTVEVAAPERPSAPPLAPPESLNNLSSDSTGAPTQSESTGEPPPDSI